MADLDPCPGCGLAGVTPGLPAAPRLRASDACYAAYGELTGYHTLPAVTGGFIHQLAVDAYQTQHCSPGAVRALAYSLAGLCLVNEHGATGRQVQQVHMALADQRVALPQVSPIDARSAGTVLDVLRSIPAVGVQRAVEEWSARVWAACADVQDDVRAWRRTWPSSVWSTRRG